jgi:hypothetical protein
LRSLQFLFPAPSFSEMKKVSNAYFYNKYQKKEMFKVKKTSMSFRTQRRLYIHFLLSKNAFIHSSHLFSKLNNMPAYPLKLVINNYLAVRNIEIKVWFQTEIEIVHEINRCLSSLKSQSIDVQRRRPSPNDRLTWAAISEIYIHSSSAQFRKTFEGPIWLRTLLMCLDEMVD